MTYFDEKFASDMVSHTRTFLAEHHIICNDPHLVLKRSFNEVWFSNMLAWFLDPKGSHNLGVQFVNEFCAFIAKSRSDATLGYKRTSSNMKRGREGEGQPLTGVRLGNASVAREFYLAGEIGRSAVRGARFCDVVLLDLDKNDGVFVAIENKLFTTNHRKQLEDFYECIEVRFKQARVREYVYLTLHGDSPVKHPGVGESGMEEIWVRCSWTNDILEILLNCKTNTKRHTEIEDFISILRWIKSLHHDRHSSRVDEFCLLIKQAAAYCLEEELNRLGDGRPGTWVTSIQGGAVRLTHSSNPKSPLLFELLPSLSIAVQGYRGRKATFEKIVIPYGVNADQVFNLLDITARDIYKSHFLNDVNKYLNQNKRRTPALNSERKQKVKLLFNFIAGHFDALRVLFTVSKTVLREEMGTDVRYSVGTSEAV